MRTTSYLIELRFQGYAKKYLKNLIFDVSKKFKVSGVTRKHVVPHITLFGPFNTAKEYEMISKIVSVCEKYQNELIYFKLKGFSRIENKVIYVDVEPSEELENLRRDISKSLLPISKSQPWDSKNDFIFHGTVAFKDIQYKFDKIWNYIKNKEEPNINQFLLRVTIVKNARILYEYDLVQKRLLDRKNSLSKFEYQKTISMLKNNALFKNDKEKIGICNYHQCGKMTKVFRCEYCNEYFCEEHLRATPIGMPKFDSTKHKDLIFMEEWHKPGGHPCAPFVNHWEAENEREEKEYSQSLDKLIKSKPIQFEQIEIKHEPSYEEPPKHKEPIFERKQKRYFKYIIGILAIIFILYLLLNFRGTSVFFGNVLNCTDGTFYSYCSKDKPYYCFNGTLIKNATICGCPYDYGVKENDCELIPRCNDKTVYGECSTNKPLYCLNGSLVKKAASCGCPLNEIAQGDNCISKYEIGPKEQTFSYVVKGNSDNIKFTVYAGLNDYLAGLSRSYYCDPTCPSYREMELKFLDQNEQNKFLKNLVEIIKSKTSNSDEQTRIAVSLVQKIPYDWEGFTTNDLNDRYPYEVLYDKVGVCAEKSRLLAFILRELGFGVVLFNYETESHMAVGIKCPLQYSYENSGYCFIEASAPSIITDAEGDYIGVGKLSSTPDMISISDGKSFDSVSEEYNDVQEWNRINKLSESSGGYLDSYNYYKWQTLVNKYGIELSEK
jgi:2'-5' RNA ligase/predicted nucleic acid binding AN1-type Zn finger protein